MFEHTQVTGKPDAWVALPDGYEPGGKYERVAIGADETITMLRDAEKHVASLPRHPRNAPIKLCVYYSPPLADSNGVIRGLVSSIKRKGEAVGVHCAETHDARRR